MNILNMKGMYAFQRVMTLSWNSASEGVRLFWIYQNFLLAQCREAYTPKASSIYSAVSIQYRHVTDRQTNTRPQLILRQLIVARLKTVQ